MIGSALVVFSLMMPVSVMLWRHGADNRTLSVAQGFLITAAAYLTASLFLDRSNGRDLTVLVVAILPLVTAMVATGRCIIFRLLKLSKTNRHRERRENK